MMARSRGLDGRGPRSWMDKLDTPLEQQSIADETAYKAFISEVFILKSWGRKGYGKTHSGCR